MSNIRISASINLKGKGLEAMRFYGEIFRAKPDYFTWADMPPCPEFTVTEELKPMIMHGELVIANGQSLMFCDDPREGEGVLGNAFSLTLLLEDEAELRRIYAALAAGGDAFMPLAPTFWSACFGMVKDKFGLTWSLNLCRMPDGSGFMVSITEFPALSLVGMKVATSMSKARTDCSALWQRFGPRMAELGPIAGESYGVSMMLNEQDFEYWAVVPAAASVVPPAGMERLEIPAASYAKCLAPNLEKMTQAFMYLYTEWPKSQTLYAPNEQAPSLERYQPHWKMDDGVEVYMPIKKK